MATPIEDLPDSELQRISETDQINATKIRNLYKEGIHFLNGERERLEAGLADFAQRGGALMAVASLIALIPFPSIHEAQIVKHFVLWVYPFLLIAIMSFIFGSIRIHVTITRYIFPAEGARDELIALRNEARVMKRILDRMNDVYKATLGSHRLTTVTILLFLLSFSLHYVSVLFYGSVHILFSLVVTIFLVFVGIKVHNNLFSNTYSEEWDSVDSGVGREINLGGIPPTNEEMKKGTQQDP